MINPQHPSVLRAFARHPESTATTAKGIVRFAVQHFTATKHKTNVLVTRQPRKAHRDFTPVEREVRRARDDRDFRRQFLARLRRREAKALQERTIEEVTRRAETAKSIIEETATLRMRVLNKECAPKPIPPSRSILIPINEEMARKVKAPLNMRGKNARIHPSRKHSHGKHAAAYTDWSRGPSKPRGVRAVHENWVRSFALISADGQTAEYIAHEIRRSLTLPAGYAWGQDENGLKAFDRKAPHVDYHPTSRDFLHLTTPEAGAGYIIPLIESNRKLREEMKAKALAEKAELEGVHVCLADALRAGNCRAGCESFAARHNLDPQRHYRAQELLEIGNGDSQRVRMAITAARLRHQRELNQGFALLAEHTA